MGYDHFWSRPKILPADEFAAWSADVAKVIAATSVTICGPNGEGAPIITPTKVAFNGIWARPNPQAQEPFFMEQVCEHGFQIENDMRWYGELGWYSYACKTNHKPYDEVVTAALALLDYHFPRLSDVSGEGKVKDWQDGIALVELATGLCLGIPSYAHWWSKPRQYDREEFAALSADIAKIVKTTDTPLAGPDGEGRPHVTPTEVAFNGFGLNARDPFFVSHDHRHPTNCRTAQRPYDIVVTAALVLLNHHIPETLFPPYFFGADACLQSTGGISDWLPGLELARRATGLELAIPILT